MRRDPLVESVMEKLNVLRGMDCRAIFNGHGLWCGTKFFAIVGAGRLYFRVNDDNRPTYVEARSGHFRTRGGRIMTDFMEVPRPIIQDDAKLVEWAERAIEAAIADGKGRKRKIRHR